MLLSLDMTKDDLLVLLGTLNTIDAGTAAAYVESLEDDDPRFQRPFLGKPLSILGYWLQQMKATSGGRSSLALPQKRWKFCT